MGEDRLHHSTTALCIVLLAWMCWQGVEAVRRPISPVSVAPQPLNFRLNINAATAGDLALLPGVGPVTAENILTYRAAHGPFAAARELENVKRIGPVTRAKIEPWIWFGPAVPPVAAAAPDGASQEGY